MNVVGNSIVYCVVALAIIVFSVLSVTSRKILRAATYLLFTLFATAILYFHMGFEFLCSSAGSLCGRYSGVVRILDFADQQTGGQGRDVDLEEKRLGPDSRHLWRCSLWLCLSVLFRCKRRNIVQYNDDARHGTNRTCVARN